MTMHEWAVLVVGAVVVSPLAWLIVSVCRAVGAWADMRCFRRDVEEWQWRELKREADRKRREANRRKL